MRQRKIQTVEPWDEFLRACSYGGRLNGPCGHPDNETRMCIVSDNCPRVKPPPPKTAKCGELWRREDEAGYRAYLEMHDRGFGVLIDDTEWQAEIARSVPGLDVPSTLYNARANYWRSEKGWVNKRRHHYRKVDWKLTYANACRFPANQVWHGTISNTVEAVKARRKAELIGKIRNLGKALAEGGHVSTDHVLRTLAEAKSVHYGKMQGLYSSGTIEHLEWTLEYLRMIECKSSCSTET